MQDLSQCAVRCCRLDAILTLESLPTKGWLTQQQTTKVWSFGKGVVI